VFLCIGGGAQYDALKEAIEKRELTFPLAHPSGTIFLLSFRGRCALGIPLYWPVPGKLAE
jgi:hypothetical protein